MGFALLVHCEPTILVGVVSKNKMLAYRLLQTSKEVDE